jgi:hypothetical protein
MTTNRRAEQSEATKSGPSLPEPRGESYGQWLARSCCQRAELRRQLRQREAAHAAALGVGRGTV